MQHSTENTQASNSYSFSKRHERNIILLLGSVQFINVLEFIIVMPLAPDFAAALNIPLSYIGYIGGSYTLAAAVGGIVSSFFVEKYDRKKVLLIATAGLVLATFAGGLATNYWQLIAARLIAGAFGGPATAQSLAIVADIIPFERRGKALAVIMSAFSLASILGVPLGLELAHVWNWRLPLLAIGLLGCLVLLLSWSWLPNLTQHKFLVEKSRLSKSQWQEVKILLGSEKVWLCYLLAASVMMGIFSLVPNIATFLIANLNFPRERIGFLYFIGGCLTFFSNQFVGRAVDRYGAFNVSIVGTIFLTSGVYFLFISPFGGVYTALFFAIFMVSSSMRTVPYQTVLSKVPDPEFRGRFMALQSSVQHFMSSIGAFLASVVLIETADGKLGNMEILSGLAIAISMFTPPLIFIILRKNRKS